MNIAPGAFHFPRAAAQWRLSLLLSTACTLALPVLVPMGIAQTNQTPTAAENAWQAETLSPDALAEQVAAASAELAALPAAAREGTPESDLRAALTRRTNLLKELIDVVARRQEIQQQQAALPQQKAELATNLTAWAALPAVEAPSQPTAEGFDAINAQLDQERATLDALKQAAAKRSQRTEDVPAIRSKLAEQKTAAMEAATDYAAQLAVASEGPDKTLLSLRAGNATLDTRLAVENLALIEAELDLETDAVAYWDRAIDYHQQVVQRAERVQSLYQQAQERMLTEQQNAAEAALARKTAEADAAVTASAKFLAEYEKRIAEIQASRAALETRMSALSALTAQQEGRVRQETDRLESLKELVNRVGTRGVGGDRVKAAYQRVRELRRAPGKISGPSVEQDLAQHRGRRFEIEEALFTLPEVWSQDFEPTRATVDGEELPAFEEAATSLREDYRQALIAEEGVLGEVIAAEKNLQDLGVQLSGAVDNLEEYVLPKLYWIQDSAPLGLHTPAQVRDEVSRSGLWLTGLFGPKARAGFRTGMAGIPTLGLAAVLFVFLPFTLMLDRRLRPFEVGGSGSPARWRASLVAVVRASLPPLNVLAASAMVGAMTFPASTNLVLATVLRGITLPWFLWRLNRAFLRTGGLAQAAFDWRPETVRLAYRSLNGLLVASLVFLLPWAVFKGHPFNADALPRVSYVLFSAAALIIVARLLRKSSPLIQKYRGQSRSFALLENWALLSAMVVLILLGTIVMDIMGLRFGAFKIATASLLSLLTTALLYGLYHVLVPISREMLRKSRRALTVAAGEVSPDRMPQLDDQLQKFLRTLFLLLGLFLIAVYWGINQHAVHALDAIHIWRASAEPLVWVSAEDVLKSILVLVLIFWLLRNLPGIYEVTLFPRLKMDPGARYALLTISRYGLFALGLFIALATIGFNLTQIGWLMAPIGLGLGFGMQEIFSNFVSGLILLIERPVRVGDVANVGDVLGTVTRINIRATTILSFDRLEHVIPNKDLITKAVTNWTLADKTTRLVIPIGVAYGSDIQQVRSVLLDLALAQPEILKDPAPMVYFMGHGDSALNFEIRFFVADLSQRMPLQDRMNTFLNEAFAARGIEIPFPQRDVHIKVHDWPAAPGAGQQQPGDPGTQAGVDQDDCARGQRGSAGHPVAGK